jgi:hypothetical protein
VNIGEDFFIFVTEFLLVVDYIFNRAGKLGSVSVPCWCVGGGRQGGNWRDGENWASGPGAEGGEGWLLGLLRK